MLNIRRKGLLLLEKLDHFNDQIDAILKGINEKEASTINQILDKLRDTPVYK